MAKRKTTRKAGTRLFLVMPAKAVGTAEGLKRMGTVFSGAEGDYAHLVEAGSCVLVADLDEARKVYRKAATEIFKAEFNIPSKTSLAYKHVEKQYGDVTAGGEATAPVEGDADDEG